MTVTLRTIYPNQLYQLRITSHSPDVEVIRYTYATGLITSPHLPSSATDILQRRWDLLTSGLLAAEKNTFTVLLADLIHVSDPGGTLTTTIYYGSSGGVFNYVFLTGLNPSANYSINVGIPHSTQMWLTGDPNFTTASPV